MDETEHEVEQSTFCYGQIVSIISQNELCATVQYKVNNTLTLQEILSERPVKQLPEFWTDFYLYFLERDEYAVTQLGNYFQLSVSPARVRVHEPGRDTQINESIK